MESLDYTLRMDLELDRLPDECEENLPPLNADGYLPPGDFAPTREEFEVRFVKPTEDRSRIFGGWNRHRQALLADGLDPTARQLLDGSFTTAKLHPADLDLAVEVPTTSTDLAALHSASPILRLLDGPGAKARYACDAYPIFCLPEDDPAYEAVTVQGVRYWTKWFAWTRDGKVKGRVWAWVGGFR